MPHEEAWQAFKWGLTYREIWPLEVENSEKIEMQVDLLNRIFKPNDKDNAAVQAKYNITVVEKVQVFLEIVDIQTPTEESIADYEKAREQYMDKTGGIWGKPLGRIICQTVVADDFTHRFKGYDLPAHLDPRINKEQRRFIFYVEEEVLAEILRGFKMDASVMVLRYPIVQEDGTEIVHEMHVLDQVKDMFCSFYRFLPNELWEARKGPRYRVINKGLEDVMEKKDDEGKGEEAEVGEGETDGDLEMI